MKKIIDETVDFSTWGRAEPGEVCDAMVTPLHSISYMRRIDSKI